MGRYEQIPEKYRLDSVSDFVDGEYSGLSGIRQLQTGGFLSIREREQEIEMERLNFEEYENICEELKSKNGAE